MSQSSPTTGEKPRQLDLSQLDPYKMHIRFFGAGQKLWDEYERAYSRIKMFKDSLGQGSPDKERTIVTIQHFFNRLSVFFLTWFCVKILKTITLSRESL